MDDSWETVTFVTEGNGMIYYNESQINKTFGGRFVTASRGAFTPTYTQTEVK